MEINKVCVATITWARNEEEKVFTWITFPFLKNLMIKLDGWRPFLFAVGNRLGYEIKNYEGDFNCPENQRDDYASERIYRMKQLTQNINGLTQAATMNLSS